MEFNHLEQEITWNTASAMFGPPGREEDRTGPGALFSRTMGAGWILYGFVRAALPRSILEIGTGGSTACLLWGLKHNGIGHIDTCDIFSTGLDDSKHLADYLKEENGEPMNHNKADVVRMIRKWDMEELVTIHHEPSTELLKHWTMPVDMVVVDGDHRKEALENDVQFLNFLNPGGYGIYHDFIACLAEVGQTLIDFISKSDEWSLLVEPNCLSLGIVQRRFTLDPKGALVSHRLTRADNPKGMLTPIQMTSPRNCGTIKPWNGAWFSLKGFHDTQDEAFKIAEEIMAYEKETGKVVQSMEEWECLMRP